MALNATALGQAMIDAIKALNPDTAAVESQIKPFTDAMATAIVDHIKNNAVVLPTNLTDSQGSPVTGTGEVE